MPRREVSVSSRTSYPIRKRQQGLALVTVMLVIALCVVLAAEMTTAQSYQIKRAQNLFERQQAFWYAMGSEHFVKALLEDTAEKDQGMFNLSQPWAMTGMSFPVDNGLIEGEVEDLYACFNLNSLYDKDIAEQELKFRKEVFVRYLENLNIESELSPDDLAANLYDWLDADDYPEGAVGYDGDMYTSLPFPYLSGNTPLAHENELRVIYGFDVVVMTQLKDKFCVIPGNQHLMLNVNTMKQEQPELLMAVLNIDQSKVDEIFSERTEEGFETIDEFWNLNATKGLNNRAQVEKYFTVNSKFFKLITNAYYNDLKFALTSVIQLNDQSQAMVIARRFGGEIEREANPEDEQPDK